MKLNLYLVGLLLAVACVSAAPSLLAHKDGGGGALFDIFMNPGKHFSYRSDSTFNGIFDEK